MTITNCQGYCSLNNRQRRAQIPHEWPRSRKFENISRYK